MKHRNVFIFTSSLMLLSLIVSVVAAPVEVAGSLQDANGFALSGKIMVVQEEPDLVFTTFMVEDDGLFRFTIDAAGELVLHASSAGHPSAEEVIAGGTTGLVNVNFVLPLAQDVEVRVVDAYGIAVADAQVRVRYHEPGKPIRRVSYEREDVTDGDGRFLLKDVGIQVPFVVDVLAPKYAPVSSRRTKLAEGETRMGEISVGEPAATVVVEVLDEKGLFPVHDAQVMLLADPAGIAPEDRDSWLHHKAFRQRATTSKLGNVQFSGVPPGNVIIRVKTGTGTGEHRAVAKSNEELRITMEVP